jgi:energy-coupling factor transporter ATP-binding protein EcfA2
MRAEAKTDVMITHDCCTVFLSAERTFVLQELKQAYGAHTFCDPAFMDTNGMPEI